LFIGLKFIKNWIIQNFFAGNMSTWYWVR